MQEPDQLREMGAFNIATFFPEGTVIKQEDVAPYRVQVRIPQYHTGIPDEDLPYYRVGYSPSVSGHNGRGGQFSTLTPGTQVICLVYDARGYNGLVFLVLPNKANDIKDGDLYGYRDDKGNSFRVGQDGTMTLTGMSGAKVWLDPQGALHAELSELHVHAGDMTLSGEMLTVLFTQIAQTAQDWNVDASNPTFTEGGGSGTAPTLTPVELPAAPDVANKTDM